MATVRKRGDRWHVQVRRRGAPSLTRSFAHRRDAERWARETEHTIDQARLPPDPKALKRTTLGELVRRYRDTTSPRKRAPEQEQINLTAFLRHPICQKTIAELRTRDFAAYRDERLQEVQPSTVQRILSPVRHMFTIAKREWGLPIAENPLDELEIRAADNRRERRLKRDEERRLLEAANTCLNPLVEPIVRFALATGMRRGEILAIRWEHVDKGNQLLLIPRTKNGHARTIPLAKSALNILEEMPVKAPVVFPISGNALRLSWARLRKRAGLDDVRFHDLRHEAISRFFEKGLTIPEAAMLSGHRDAKMLFRYAHAAQKSVLNKLDPTET